MGSGLQGGYGVQEAGALSHTAPPVPRAGATGRIQSQVPQMPTTGSIGTVRANISQSMTP